MNIRWDNIMPLVSLIVVLWLIVKLSTPLRNIWRLITGLGGHDGDPFIGLLALATVCLTVVGVVRIMYNGRR